MHSPSRWHVHQSNGYNPTWDLREEGGGLVGTAVLTSEEGLRAGYSGAVTQAFQGRLKGHELAVRIEWPAKRDGSHSVGVYKGLVHGDRIEGHCHDESLPNPPTVSWHAERF